MAAIVGRAAELADIDRALAEAAAGRGRLVLVSGPPGIGKSRLADAAVAVAARYDLAVATGYALDDPGAPALWPWLRLMRGWPGTDALPTGDAGEPDAGARFRLFMAVSDLIGARAADPDTGGLLLVLEDMHWADRTSVLLLRHLVAELATARLAIVVTCRDGVAGPLLDVLPDLVRGDAARALELAGLSPAEVAAWLPVLTGGADARLANALHERTDGNPLLVRLAAENLARHATSAGADQLAELMTDRPQLRRLVAGRVDGLAPDVRDLIDAASVLGERIAPDILAAMTDAPPGEVRAGVDAALAAGVLSRDDATGGTRFQHALVRDAVYAQLPASRQAGLHRRAAEALETRAPDAAAGSIAHHWQRADAPDATARCQQWAERADDQARAVLAFDDAARFAQLAVTSALATGLDPAEHARLLVRSAEALFLANRLAESIATCVEAAERAEGAGRPDLLAEAALVVHGVGDPYAIRTIPALCQRALAALPAGDHVTRARLLAQIAVGEAEGSGGPQAADLAAAALAEAERSGDPGAILEAIAARHLAITMPQTVEERLELGRRAVELATAVRQPVAALWGHLWRVDAAFQLGNLPEVDHELTEIDRVARERGSALARWHHHRYLAVRQALIGDFAAARAENEASLVLGRRMGDLSADGMYYAFQVQLCWLRGGSREVGPGWEQMLAHAPPMPLVRVSVPLIHASEGRLDLARAEFEEFRVLPRTFPVGTRWAATVSQIGMTAALLGDVEVCAEVYELLAPFAHYYSGDGSGGVFSHGANAHLVGDLARVSGRLDDALAHYRDAVAMNSRIGARPFTALSRLGWAQALLARGGSDLVEAKSLAVAAAAEFRRLDMSGRLVTATQLVDAIETTLRTASPLSSREAEIAVLIGDALSNREIADRLVLSERTVESHVRSILAKLGFNSRTEIATWTVRGQAVR